MKLKVTSDKKFIKVIESNEREFRQLKLSLTKKIKDHYFHPLVKKKLWNGEIKFMDTYGRIPFGLWNKVLTICERYNFECEIEGLEEVINDEFDENEYREWETEYYKDSEKKPRHYQTKAVVETLRWVRCNHQIATSAGKTMIMFNTLAYLKHKNVIGIFNEDGKVVSKKMLIVVPNIQLVSQTMDSFEEFSCDKTKLKYKIQPIFSGEEKTKKDVDVIIGTYQSLCKLPKTFYENIEVLCVDEAHTAKTKSIQKVFELADCNNIRFGLSGTAKTITETADTFTIEGNLGPIVSNVSASSLFKEKFATPLKIRMLYLNYLDDKSRQILYKQRRKTKNDKDKKASDIPKLLQNEQDVIRSNQKRFDYIIELITKPTKNTLVLFKDVKNSYGKRIYETLKEKINDNEQVFYVDSTVELKRRKYYRQQMNLNDDKKKILVASFGTTSTGIDISNLHYIFLIESYKSEIIIKQTIGRGMRLNKNKHILNIIDIVDDLSYNGHLNYVYKQSLERKIIYRSESFPYKEYKIQL